MTLKTRIPYLSQRSVYLLFLALLYALLQGCAAPIIVASAAGGAMVAQDERTPSAVLDDQLYESKIEDKIYTDPSLKGKVHINVTSYNGIVLLSGEALSRAQRNRALQIANADPKARRIYNEVRVADLTDLKSRSKDTLITTKIKTNMFTAENFKSTRVKVITEFRTVYLMGLVTQDTGKRAADIARNVSGVKRVVKLFEYR